MNTIDEVKLDEGRRPCVYQDSRGYWTIGDGILVDARLPGAGLRPEEMDFITANRIKLTTDELVHCAMGNWVQAATEFLSSRWATQTPARAQRLAQQIRTGAFPA